jgi:hypothetical protein
MTLSWQNPVLFGCLFAVGAFLLRIGMAFLQGNPLGLEDYTNYVGPLMSGLLLGLLVKFDYLIAHSKVVVTVFSFLLLCVVAVRRNRSQSL